MHIENLLGGEKFRFRRLVVEVMRSFDIHISLPVENYLASCLARNIRNTSILTFRVADRLIEDYASTGFRAEREKNLRGAEACLFLVGLFPEVALRRNVKLGFYLHWGKVLYYAAAVRENQDLKPSSLELAEEFAPMARVLRRIRDLRDRRARLLIREGKEDLSLIL